MKITITSYIYPYPDRGYNPGIERVVQEYARELVQQGHDVHVLTTYRNGGTKSSDIDKGVKIHRVADTRYYLGKIGSLLSMDMCALNLAFYTYRSLLESSDIVHTFTPISWKFFSTPLVAHYHHWDDPADPLEYLYLPTSHQLWLTCYEQSDRVVAISKYSAGDLASRGINRSKIDVVPNGVNLEVYQPGQVKKNLGKWKTTLLYVGPLVERKGLKYLIQAMPEILEEHPSTGLILVGGGDEMRLTEIAKQEGVSENIQFEGFVPDEELPEYYRAADIFTFPSLLEGFGMVLLEAMASGLPVVASDVTAIPEVVGDAGCLVPESDSHALAEEISNLITKDSLRESLSKRAVNRSHSLFSWKSSAKQLVDIYSDLIR